MSDQGDDLPWYKRAVENPLGLLASLGLPAGLVAVTQFFLKGMALPPLGYWGEVLPLWLSILPSLLGGGLAYLVPSRSGAADKNIIQAYLIGSTTLTAVAAVCLYFLLGSWPRTTEWSDVWYWTYHALCVVLYAMAYLAGSYALTRLVLVLASRQRTK